MSDMILEDDILDINVRKKVIKDIQSEQNRCRKAEAYKRYECFKDKTSKYTTELLLRQFDQDTVYEMQYAITNISFVRKVVDKLARVYANGAVRKTDLDQVSESVHEVAEVMLFNTKMKKANRHFKLQKNLQLFLRPIECDGRYSIELMPMSPFLYDVLPQPKNPHEPMAIILSDYAPERGLLYAMDPAAAGRTMFGANVRNLAPYSTNEELTIATKGPVDQDDEDDKQYIWWTKNYHFTTNHKGEIIGEPSEIGQQSVENPIRMLPFVTLSEDQDDSFWSEGGDDLADSGIKINAMLTNINHIAITQGYGQPIMSGKNPPKAIKLGPNHCITMEQNEGEPEPKFQFVSANPPIDQLSKLMDTYIALLLSTNNLSTSSVASNLSGGKDFASGVALMIDKAESMEDVEDQAQIFKDAERKAWEVVARWLEYFQQTNKAMLVDELQSAIIPVGTKVNVHYPQPQLLLSEQEKLDIIQKRKDLGINSMVELIQKDNPDLTLEQAEEKLKQILEEKMQAMSQSIMQSDANPETPSDSNNDAEAETQDDQEEDMSVEDDNQTENA